MFRESSSNRCRLQAVPHRVFGKCGGGGGWDGMGCNMFDDSVHLLIVATIH